MNWFIYNIYFPVVLLAGKIWRIAPDKTELYLIKLNNYIRGKGQGKAEKILILTPSCLQNKDCKNNVVEDAQNCRKCGKCAVACEKELASGIIDTYPVAVYAVINQRPFGPCVNTDVNIQEVESIIMEVSRRKLCAYIQEV